MRDLFATRKQISFMIQGSVAQVGASQLLLRLP